MPDLIAKAFRYSKTGVAKDVTFTGFALLDDDGLVLIHTGHVWDSAQAGMAVGGLLGVFVNWLCTRKKVVRYPFDTFDFGAVREKFEGVPKAHKIKDDAQVSLVPRAAITGYDKGFIKGLQVLVQGEGVDEMVVLTGKAKGAEGFLDARGIPCVKGKKGGGEEQE